MHLRLQMSHSKPWHSPPHIFASSILGKSKPKPQFLKSFYLMGNCGLITTEIEETFLLTFYCNYYKTTYISNDYRDKFKEEDRH